MSLSVFGINHNTAPVSIREKVVVNPEKINSCLTSLIQEDGIKEAMILSTCNRTEVYYYSERDQEGQKPVVMSWLYEYFFSMKKLFGLIYSHCRKLPAVRHILRVACGLDSMVLGEPQILGQLKEAYRIASETGTTGKMLNKLLQHSFSVAKQVRTDTAIVQALCLLRLLRYG